MFETKIGNNDIELMLATEQHDFNCKESRTRMSVASDACGVYFNCVQSNDEALPLCTRSFKVAKEILQFHLGGPILVTNAMEENHLACIQIKHNEESSL